MSDGISSKIALSFYKRAKQTNKHIYFKIIIESGFNCCRTLNNTKYKMKNFMEFVLFSW